MTLESFLSEKSNLHAREELLNYRLLFDLKLAAMQVGYHLLTYYSDVDHDGFDIIVDDHHTVRKIQLKTVSMSSATPNWQIHRSIIRPTMDNWERLGFTHHGCINETEAGIEGGFVLMEYNAANSELPVTYWYTDIYVITAIHLGLIKRNSATTTAVKNFRKNLVRKKLTEKISISKSYMVRVEKPHNLLSMLALFNDEKNNWHNRIVTIGMEDHWGPKGKILPSELTKMKNEVPSSLKTACGHPDP
jgi:hypothetical protein